MKETAFNLQRTELTTGFPKCHLSHHAPRRSVVNSALARAEISLKFAYIPAIQFYKQRLFIVAMYVPAGHKSSLTKINIRPHAHNR